MSDENHPTGEELAWMPAIELAERIARGELTAQEALEASLARIERLDGELHSFVTVAADDARRQARAADGRQRRGEPLGPLHGVPISLKDEVWTAGVRSTAGSLLYADFVPDTDAEVVTRLRRAGAVVVGKTQLPEFAAWPRSTNLVAPECRNPHDRSRISGASSGGSAVSVAAGLVPLSLGSDGGGSIRIPSALCGTFGLFPTPGLVPATRTFSYSPFASLGPISRTVRDAALMLQTIAGHDPADPGSCTRVVPDYLADLEAGVDGLRVAFTPDFGWIDVDRRIVAVAERAVHALEGGGAIVEQPGVEIDDIWPGFAVATLGAGIHGGEAPPFTASDEHRARVAANLDRLTPPLAVAAGMAPPSRRQYEDAIVTIDRARAQIGGWLDRYDVICSPTMATVAPLVPDGWEMPYPDGHMGTNFTSIANVGKLTAASYPCGLVDGLPAGLQVIGPPRAEALVLRVCRALEHVAPYDAPLS
jgi:Asp-tRNA(Asn)/Glu-tRNA(Gln) amidotransferase A subunit family amidase